MNTCERRLDTANRIDAPVSASHSRTARLVVAQVRLDTFEGPELGYAGTTARRRKELESIRMEP